MFWDTLYALYIVEMMTFMSDATKFALMMLWYAHDILYYMVYHNYQNC